MPELIYRIPVKSGTDVIPNPAAADCINGKFCHSQRQIAIFYPLFYQLHHPLFGYFLHVNLEPQPPRIATQNRNIVCIAQSFRRLW